MPNKLRRFGIYNKSNSLNYIGNCKIGKSDGSYGRLAFIFWKTGKEIYNYAVFSPSYGENFSDISFCAFSSSIRKDEPKSQKDIYEHFVCPTCYQMLSSEKSLIIYSINKVVKFI